MLLCLKAISSRVILRLSSSTSMRVTMNLPSTSSPPLWFLRVLNLSALTQIKGDVYSSLPMPQLKPARLKASLASPFSASVFDGVPTSSLLTHWAFSSSQMEIVQFALSRLCSRFQLNAPTASSSIAMSHLASL